MFPILGWEVGTNAYNAIFKIFMRYNCPSLFGFETHHRIKTITHTNGPWCMYNPSWMQCPLTSLQNHHLWGFSLKWCTCHLSKNQIHHINRFWVTFGRISRPLAIVHGIVVVRSWIHSISNIYTICTVFYKKYAITIRQYNNVHNCIENKTTSFPHKNASKL